MHQEVVQICVIQPRFLGLTQEELTARCTVLGWNISRGTLAKMESQVRRITDSEVAQLAKALKVNIDTLYQ